jgi:isoaspartyl peptidase/L-asparaginase-like protein (Ntn-hydrolase superfamily)
MAHDGVLYAKSLLENGGSVLDAVEGGVKKVEDYPFYKSVGYGGLPNERGILEMDAAFMDGNTLQIGAIAGVTDIANPVSVARKLSLERFNSFRVGQGANEYAMQAGFERKNMLTERAKQTWEKRLLDTKEQGITAYDGHDTVCFVGLDTSGHMASAVSTSGLFMKKAGRVGDSTISGSGFYVDSAVGGAAATGVGEDIMKGVLSYEITRLMSEGLEPQEACDRAVYSFDAKLKQRFGKAGTFSVVALNCRGAWGIATNCEFTFSVATEKEAPAIYIANPAPEGKTQVEPVTQQWLDAYEKRIKAPI